MRTSVILLLLAFGLLLSNTDQQAAASIVVGTLPLVGTDNDNPQDKLPDVLAVIDAYNAAKDPDLTKDIEQFKKTGADEDSDYLFSATPPTNGFSFFSDAGGTNPITTEGTLTSLITAWFSYVGPEILEYYSVKTARGFSLYDYQPGILNLLTRADTEQEISHVVFWSSTNSEEEPPEEEEPPQNPTANPEPSSLVLAALAIASLGLARRRRR